MSDSALQVPLHDLAPQIGGHQEVHIDWTVPEGWQTEVLRLDPLRQIPLDVELTSIDDGVLVRVWAQSTADTELRGECVRCLDPIGFPWEVDAAEVYEDVPRGHKRKAQADDDIQFEGDELDRVLQVENDHVDIEPLLRDGILAAAPLQPLCSDSCAGLCAHCGIRLDEAGPDHHHEFLDPRFAALEGFFGAPSTKTEGDR